MREIGKILVILDSKRVLAKVEKKIDEDSVYRVFSRIASPPELTELQIESIDIPKGELRFVTKQKDDIWLAEVFNSSQGRKQLVPELSIWDRLRASSQLGISSIDTKFRVSEEEPRSSAVLDQSQSVKIKLQPAVQVGDLVADWTTDG